MNISIAASILAALIVLASEAIYIFSIFHPSPKTGARTRPSRSTFWIWTLVQAMLSVSYFSAGGGMAAGLSVAYAISFLVIALLSIRWGYSKWERIDTICLIGAVISAVLWSVSGSALLATVLLLSTDLLGAIPTLKKARVDPFTEERLAWLLTTIATVVNVFAIIDWSVADMLYTPYLFFINGLIAYYLWRPVWKK